MPTEPGPRHLVLRPGTPVLTRAAGLLQVGLDPPSVQADDEPAVRQLLTALSRSTGLPEPAPGTLPPEAAAVLDRLRAAGLVVAVPAGEGVPEALDLLLRAQFGPDAVRRRAARARAAVSVQAATSLEPTIDGLLDRAGLRRVATGADVHLVVGAGTLDRELLDPLVRAALPHLVVSGAAGGRRLGPFVEPGHTACLRCVDAHESLGDPRRPLLVAQAASHAARRPQPLDPLLDLLVLAWAVRDLTRYLEGETPSTWSTTFDVGPLHAPAAVQWGRHPDCGCAWDAPALFA